ncbi:Ceramide synthase 3 [Nowakowskiella sp. JEL0078]|nr:Ceramide synthase 3 [Nowakowskiella sp. JEL0078]
MANTLIQEPKAIEKKKSSQVAKSASLNGQTLIQRKPADDEKKTVKVENIDPVKSVANLRTKFVVAAWRCLNYTTTAIFAITILVNEPGGTDPASFFRGWPEKQSMSYQKDFVVMSIHHATTIALIYFSYTWGFYRIGAAVFTIHEIADPFMEFGKCALYVGKQSLADICLVLFAVAFIITRNIIFPAYIISSIPYYAYHDDGSLIPFGRADVHYGFFALLSILEIMHIYWASLILKVAIKSAVSNGLEGDIRDEDED